jgi:hypothetical protein
MPSTQEPTKPTPSAPKSYAELVALRDSAKARASQKHDTELDTHKQRLGREHRDAHETADAEFRRGVVERYRAVILGLHERAIPIVSRLMGSDVKAADAALLAATIRSTIAELESACAVTLRNSSTNDLAALCAGVVEAKLIKDDPNAAVIFGASDARHFDSAAGARMIAANAFAHLCAEIGQS